MLKRLVLSRKLAQGIVLAVALGVTAVLVTGILKGTAQKEQQQKDLLDDAPEAEMKLTDMEYTEMQGGRRVWSLKASEARYYQDDQKTQLKSVHLTFFFENGEEAYLESNQGVLYAGTKNIEVWDAVRAKLPRGYELATERAFYEHERKVIYSQSPIEISGSEVQINGSHWKYDIQEHKAAIEGEVRATFSFLPEDANESQ
jgi:LPS export ABC transporter protein LptC